MITKFSERDIRKGVENGRRIYDKINEIIDVLNEEVIEEEFYLSWQSPLMIPPENEDLLIDTDDGYKVARAVRDLPRGCDRYWYGTFIPEGDKCVTTWRVSPGVWLEDSRVKRWARLPRRKR